jgi:methionyl-tRNA formyltransferase
LKIVFFGTSSFAANILEDLLDSQFNIIAVVTRSDKPAGRSLQLQYSPVKQAVLKQAESIPLYQPMKASTDDFVAEMSALQPDLFLVVAYGEIIKKTLLDVPRYGAVNMVKKKLGSQLLK